MIIIQRTIIEDHIVLLIFCMLPSHVDLVSVDINCTSMYVGGFLVYNRKQHNNVYIYMITTACIFIEAHTVHVRCMIWYDIDYIMCGVIAIRGFPRFRTWQCFTWDEGMPMSAFSVPIFSAHDAFPYLRVTLEEISCRTKQKKSDCWKVDDPTAFCFKKMVTVNKQHILGVFLDVLGLFLVGFLLFHLQGRLQNNKLEQVKKALQYILAKHLMCPRDPGATGDAGYPVAGNGE